MAGGGLLGRLLRRRMTQNISTMSRSTPTTTGTAMAACRPGLHDMLLHLSETVIPEGDVLAAALEAECAALCVVDPAVGLPSSWDWDWDGMVDVEKVVCSLLLDVPDDALLAEVLPALVAEVVPVLEDAVFEVTVALWAVFVATACDDFTEAMLSDALLASLAAWLANDCIIALNADALGPPVAVMPVNPSDASGELGPDIFALAPNGRLQLPGCSSVGVEAARLLFQSPPQVLRDSSNSSDRSRSAT